MSEPKALAGRVAVVTGGGRGIGLAIARSLAEDGASVVVSGRDAGRLDAAAVEIDGMGAPALAVVADVSRREDVDRLVEATRERFGRIDVLVNNAGITRDQLLIRMKDEDWDQVLDTNLRGIFLTTRAIGKVMMRQKAGRIINISSIVAEMGNAGQSNYVASKAGLIGLTKAIAIEIASRNITVNAVAPGFIETPMTDVLSAEVKEDLKKRVPLGRMGTPADVTAAIIFLASDEAAYITGHVLDVNGGMYLS